MVRCLLLAVILGSLIENLHAEESAKETRGDETPSALVGRVQTALMDAMKGGEKLGYQGRFDKLAPIVRETHGFESFARVALAKYWGNLTDEQKKAFMESFARLAIASYAAIFDDYSGETFKIASEKPMGGGKVLVHSIYTTDESKPIQFDYEVMKVEGKWQVVNLIADGISILAIKKAEFESVIASEGFDGLLKRVEQQISERKKGASQKP